MRKDTTPLGFTFCCAQCKICKKSHDAFSDDDDDDDDDAARGVGSETVSGVASESKRGVGSEVRTFSEAEPFQNGSYRF